MGIFQKRHFRSCLLKRHNPSQCSQQQEYYNKYFNNKSMNYNFCHTFLRVKRYYIAPRHMEVSGFLEQAAALLEHKNSPYLSIPQSSSFHCCERPSLLSLWAWPGNPAIAGIGAFMRVCLLLLGACDPTFLLMSSAGRKKRKRSVSQSRLEPDNSAGEPSARLTSTDLMW